jgi:antitoxin component of MazEF toxin-antitoxin module
MTMIHTLVHTGNSTALILTRDMKDHLGITDTVEVIMEKDRIVLRKPLTFGEAATRSDHKFANAYRELAE